MLTTKPSLSFVDPYDPSLVSVQTKIAAGRDPDIVTVCVYLASAAGRADAQVSDTLQWPSA